MLLISCAVAQSAAPGTVTVERLRVVPDRANVRVEITLSAVPGALIAVTVAKNPNRLVLDLPNTLSNAKQQQVSVNYKGVRAVRLGLNSAHPPVTRVVVDLDLIRPYVLQNDGNRVMLIIGAKPNEIVGAGQGARAAGASGGLVGLFSRRPASPPMEIGRESASGLPTPPPPGTPITFPEEQASTAGGSTGEATPARPSAAHPDRGSLQEGTVFPGLGSPGTGTVPSQGISASTGASNTSTALAAPASGRANSPAETVFPASTIAKGGVPSGLVTPPPHSNPEKQSSGTSSNVAPASPKILLAPVLNAESIPASNRSVPGALAEVTGGVPTVQPKTETVAGTNQDVVSSPAPSSERTVAHEPLSISPGQSGDQNKSAATSENESAEVASEPPALTEAPTVAEAEPAAIATPASPENTAALPLATPDKVPAGTDLPVLALRAVDPNLRTVFKVKYVAEGVAYLDGGRSAGLTEGMKLEIKDTDLPAQQGSTADPNDPRVVAELEVTALAETSAVTDIRLPKRPVKPGDLAYLVRWRCAGAGAAAFTQCHAKISRGCNLHR